MSKQSHVTVGAVAVLVGSALHCSDSDHHVDSGIASADEAAASNLCCQARPRQYEKLAEGTIARNTITPRFSTAGYDDFRVFTNIEVDSLCWRKFIFFPAADSPLHGGNDGPYMSVYFSHPHCPETITYVVMGASR